MRPTNVSVLPPALTDIPVIEVQSRVNRLG